MGMFNKTTGNSMENNLNIVTEDFMTEYNTKVFYAEAMSLCNEEREKLINDPSIKSLEEKGLIGKHTLVRLSKVDDLERRVSMASIQMAKENNDPLYEQLIKNRIKEKKLLAAIDRKYANKATRVAKAAQKTYISANPIGSTFGGKMI